MELKRLFVAMVLAGSLAVIGCGSDDSSSNNGGGNSAGNGGGDAAEACSGPICAANDTLRATCESEFDQCVETGVNVDECVVAAELICGAGVPF